MRATTRAVRIPMMFAMVVLSLWFAVGQTLAAPVGTPSTDTPKDGGSWTVAITEEPDTLEPHKTGAAVTQTILRNVCDPLIAKDFDGNYVPGLAKSWTISED